MSIENIVSRCVPISKLILVRSRKYIYFDQRIRSSIFLEKNVDVS